MKDKALLMPWLIISFLVMMFGVILIIIRRSSKSERLNKLGFGILLLSPLIGVLVLLLLTVLNII